MMILSVMLGLLLGASYDLFHVPNEWRTWIMIIVIAFWVSLPHRLDPAFILAEWVHREKKPRFGRGNDNAEIIETVSDEEVRRIEDRAR